MENLKSFEEFVDNLILESQIVFSQRNNDADKYEQFSKEIVSRILDRENVDDNYKWDFSDKCALVVNDIEMYKTLKDMGCDTLYIHMDEPQDDNYFEPDFGGNGITNTLDFENIIDVFLGNRERFDIVINVSIPIYKDDIPQHSYTYEKVAKINEMIFNTSIMRNKMGVDKTMYYTIDEPHTYQKFYSLINKQRDKDIVPEVIGGLINKSQSIKYGFDGDDDRTLIRIFIRSLDRVRAEKLDEDESNETGERVSAKGTFIGRTNPNIYCFKTANVPGCLKVGDTFRPMYVRMSEWQDVFGNENQGFEHEDTWEWSAVENNWVFRDYTVHKYLKDMKRERLYNRAKYEKYFKPISDEFTLDNTYSNEFFVETTPEDVDVAVNSIRNDIRTNIELLRDSLKPFNGEEEEEKTAFFDERELQKKCIDNFTKKLNDQDSSNNYLIYAVMRFGKTYTAIRCIQEFYKNRRDNCTKFSLITTAKPEVKNEWIGGFRKYISDSIDETGKGGYGKDVEDNETHKFVKRTFEDFDSYTIDELNNKVKKFFLSFKGKDDELYQTYIKEIEVDDEVVEEGRKRTTVKPMKRTELYLGEHALEKYIELNGNKGKNIVLFVSLQDLAGSNEEIKYKHKFFYDCPLDMIILDEVHYGSRAKKYGAPTGTSKENENDEYEGMSEDEKEAAKKENQGEEKLNKLAITKETIKLHLSGTPYKILKDKVFDTDNILAAFTSTHLRLEKEKWEKDNLPLRIDWEEKQEKLREKGSPEAKEEWENPYSADKNPYFGIPKLTHYSYDLSKFDLNSLRNSEKSTCMEELFRVVNTSNGKSVSSTDYKKTSAKEIPIDFLHKADVIKLFRIIDGARRDDEERKILSILNADAIKSGHMCKNILIALPTKDACDCLAKLLKETEPDGSYKFKILGKYEIVNAAGRREVTESPISRIRGLEDKTITLTCDMLLTGVTVEPWDTIFYMKDGMSPEGYDQAKFRVQSPYINKLPIFDKSIVKKMKEIQKKKEKGEDITEEYKPPVLKQDLKPETIFVDFLPDRMFKILDQQMYNEQSITGVTADEILKSTPVAVIDGDNLRVLDSAGFSDRYNDILEKEGGDTGYMRLIKKIHCSDNFLKNDELMDKIWEFHDFVSSGSDEDAEPTPDEDKNPDATTPVNPSRKGGKGVKSTPKPVSEDKLMEKRRERFDKFINNIAIYNILRKDRETISFARNNDIIGKMIESVNNKEIDNSGIVHAVFFNGNFNVSDDVCVKKVTDVLNILRDAFNKKSNITRNGVEIAISRVETIMNKKESIYKKISTMFNSVGNNRLGATEYVSDPRLIKHMINSDFVIFNEGCKVLDCYGSKVGEFADHILNNEEVKRTKGIVDPKNYYILCYTHLTYEMNKFVLEKMGVPEKNILFCNNVKEIESKLGNMKFSVICGNPPFKGKGNPLYMQITKSIYENNMDDRSVMCMINPTALVDNKYMEKDDANYLRYKDLKLIDFYYESSIRGTFTSADIGNDVAIFTYRKDGEMSLFDDKIKEIRFKGHKEDKKIIDKLLGRPMIGSYSGYFGYHGQRNDLIEHIKKHSFNGHNYVCMAYNRGNIDDKTGGHKWDWPTLMNSLNLKIQPKLPETAINAVDFKYDSETAIKWIQWMNTDFIMFIVDYYKYAMANQPILFKHLPQPPTSGDFSDESICKEFDLKMSDMEYIHEKMRNFGWKTKDNKDFASDYSKVGYNLPSIKLDGTQDTLLKYIEELNKDVKTPSSSKLVDLDSLTDEELEKEYLSYYNDWYDETGEKKRHSDNG